MGWMFGWNSRKDLVDHLTKTWDTEKHTTVCLKKFFSGNNMWTVWERTSKDGSEPYIDRYIVLFLIKGGNHCTEGHGYGWGYKDVGEECGPCETSCPISFLDMVPDPGGYATAWRARVRAARATRNQKLVVGQVVRLTNGKDYKITSVSPLRGEDLSGGWSPTYRIPRRMLTLELAKKAEEIMEALNV